jgi:hypothetical protein
MLNANTSGVSFALVFRGNFDVLRCPLWGASITAPFKEFTPDSGLYLLWYIIKVRPGVKGAIAGDSGTILPDSDWQRTGSRMVARSFKRGSSDHRPGPHASAVRLANWDAACAELQTWSLGSQVRFDKSTICPAARLLLCFHRNELVVLHGFIKKTQKTPSTDLELAKRRMKEVTK